MATSRIEQIIEDIYDFVESCKPQVFSQAKVIVPKDELYDLLDELRLRTPDEIKRYQKIISNREALVKEAEDKAAGIIEEAKKKAEAMLNENEIMQQAYYRANEMISNATAQSDQIMNSANRDAEQIRTGALSYANEMLAEIEGTLSNTYESTRSKSEMMLNAIKGNLDIIISNRRELNGEAEAPEDKKKVAASPDYDSFSDAERNSDAAQYNDEDFNYDEDTFIKNI